MSEGHPKAGTDGERDIDFGDMTEEVELNLPREEAVERDPLGEDARDLPGVTSSGESATKQEELYGARPKWNCQGQPLPVIEELRDPGAEATGGMDGPEMNGGGMRAPAPKLPPLRHDRPSVGVVTPPRRDADRHGGFRAPEARLPSKGTRVASQVFPEARDKDVIPHRRNVPWSPDNVLIDTLARLQMLCQPPDRGHLRRLKCRGLLVRLAGSNTGRCLMPLCSQTDGTMQPRRCSCSPIWRGMP